MRYFRLFLIVIFLNGIAFGQYNRHLIKLTDKTGTPHQIQQPQSFLTERSIQRRIRYDIAIDSSDLPISPNYLNQLQQINGVQILAKSKWNNEVAIQVENDLILQNIRQLPFVVNSRPVASRISSTTGNEKWNDFVNTSYIPQRYERNLDAPLNYGSTSKQINIHRGDFLHQRGFTGDSMSIAVMDAGFFNYDQLFVFDSLRTRQQIYDVWDFVEQHNQVAEDHQHGTHCLGILAADAPGQMIGSAPHARYQLYRTEDIRSEYPIEEFYLLCALERADSIGVDLCSISLGYNTFDIPAFDYGYLDMNGNTSISSRAVNMAAQKGMMPVVAVGNEGGRPWRFLLTPGDADECLSVGAVDSLGNRAYFSSHGPSSDGQIKPALMSLGEAAIIPNEFSGLPQYGSGTSYACPNLAGLTACLWQAFPELNHPTIQQALQNNASQAEQPDSLKGYGIPDMKKAFVWLQKNTSVQQARFDSCKGLISLNIKAGQQTQVRLERRLEDESSFYPVKQWILDGPHQWNRVIYADDLAGTNLNRIEYRFNVQLAQDTAYFLSVQSITPSDCRIILPAQNNWNVYPNPVTQKIRIKLERKTSGVIHLILRDARGLKVWSTSINTIPGTDILQLDLSNYPSGVYWMSLEESNKLVETKKILKINSGF